MLESAREHTGTTGLSGLPVPLQIGLLVLLFAMGSSPAGVGWLQPPHAGKMLRLVITVGLPALFLADVSRIPLRAELVMLPVSAVLIMLVMLALSLLGGQVAEAARRGSGRAARSAPCRSTTPCCFRSSSRSGAVRALRRWRCSISGMR